MEQSTLDLFDESPLATAVESFHGDYRFLSNFWYCTVYFEGQKYPSVEHAYVGAKIENPEDRYILKAILRPGDARKYGQTVKLSPGFDDRKLDIMEDLIRQKFAPGSKLAQLLLETGDRLLIEGNRWGDTFWGVCRGKGENHLGKIIMKIRSELQLIQQNELNKPKTRSRRF